MTINYIRGKTEKLNDKKHDQHDELKKAAEAYNNQLEEKSRFYIRKIEGNGSVISLGKNISNYLNDDQAEKKIQKWFEETFVAFEKFKNHASQINWK